MLRAMRARFLVSAVCVSVLSTGALGCAYSELRTVLRAQFASELDCPEVKIQKRALWYASEGPDQYKISGCGVMRTYTCPDPDGLVSYDETQCTWVEGDADAPTVDKPDEEPGTAGMDMGMDTDTDTDMDTDTGMDGSDEFSAPSDDDDLGEDDSLDADDDDADNDDDDDDESGSIGGSAKGKFKFGN